jgi:thiol-disulfide isomerase/thioredoxin
LLLTVLLLMVVTASLAAAAPTPPLVPFSKPAFTAAQAENRPIVVFVHASWCVTCRKQEPILRQLLSDPAFKAVTVFVVDYDDKPTLKALNVADRSTLVAFHGTTERARSSFSTDPAEIRGLFGKAL